MNTVENEHTAPILDALRSVQQDTGYGWGRTFEDWVQLMFSDLRRDDDAYGDLVDKYRDEYGNDVTDSVFEQYSIAFAELVSATRETNADVLGEVHQRTGLGSDESGQYFTDGAVADLMSEMVLSTDEALPDEGEIESATVEDPYKVADPTCGSGRMLISVGHRIEQMDVDCPAIFHGQDKSAICARMTAINFALHGLSGVVVQGDSLLMETVASWEIRPSTGLFGAPIRAVTDPSPS